MDRLDRYEIDGRELSIVLAKDRRKTPDEMKPRQRDRKSSQSRSRSRDKGGDRDRDRRRSVRISKISNHLKLFLTT